MLNLLGLQGRAPALRAQVFSKTLASFSAMAFSGLQMDTSCGIIKLKLRADAAPITVDYVVKAVKDGLYDNKSFYRSDFVIQCGLHGSGVNPPGSLSKNETKANTFISNTRGTCRSQIS